ncbi:MAG TPA: protein kinase [Labilithrix sp.]|nr:protein kinase [Labilithrix sp.]
MSENDDSLPRLLSGRYRLEAKLGSGGMGVVYRATDQTMHRAVAVKLVRGVDGVTLDDEVAGRFLREAKNTARVQHENIIEVYDLGRSDQGDMFFVMELLEGESLSTKLRREGKISPALTVHIARQMCAALHVAHSAGIIHRDLKPANVMLVKRGNDPSYVKVLDFGVAKSYTADQQTQLTHTGMLVGTVEYMAPEQIMGRTVDGRTDLYALGVVMYRMLTGKPPFRDGGVPALIHAHLNVYAKPMSETNPEITGELDRVILRCLAKQPEQRYESMEELSRALAAAMEPAEPLMNLDYQDDEDDIYEAGDKTEVARPPRVEPARAPQPQPQPQPPRPERVAPPAVLPSVASTRAEEDETPLEESFDDATIKMDRPDPGSLPRRVPRAAASLDDSSDRTAIMNREELSTAKRPVPDSVTRVDSAAPRECAMCRTMNAPHARACTACGVSLANEDQEAVRARVTAPRTAHLAAPQMPPPTSAPYPQPHQQHPPFAHSPAQGIPGIGAPQPMQAPNPRQSYASVSSWQPPQAPHAPQSPSVWQRFLTWTGLR